MLFARCSYDEVDDGVIEELAQGFNDQALGVTDIFETRQQQVINRFDVSCKRSVVAARCCSGSAPLRVTVNADNGTGVPRSEKPAGARGVTMG